MLEVEGPVIPAAAFGSGGGNGAVVGVSECEWPKPPAEATVERDKPVMAKAGEKKRKQKQKKRVTVDAMTMPFPVLTEEQLARIRDPVEREEWRELMARAAKHYYESREELAALGYA